MKKLIIILFLIPFFVNGQIKKDAYYHSGAGILLSGGMYIVDKYSKRDITPIAPTMTAVLFAFGKEMGDSFTTGNFSGRDFLITSASGAATNCVFYFISKRKHKKKKYIDFNINEFELVKN